MQNSDGEKADGKSSRKSKSIKKHIFLFNTFNSLGAKNEQKSQSGSKIVGKI